MKLGEQLVAPHGFESLGNDVVYHFLYSEGARNRVVLLTFNAPASEKKEDPRLDASKVRVPTLIHLRRDRFEEAVRSLLIRPHATPSELPHWLGGNTVADLLEHDKEDHARRRPHAQRMDMTLAHLWPALEGLVDILGSEDPNNEINKYARACTPVQHESRFKKAVTPQLPLPAGRRLIGAEIHRG